MPDLTDSPIGWVARHIRRYVTSGGRSGHRFSGRPTLLITTRGRRSGKLRRTALYYARDGHRYLVVASGGEPTHPAWYLNLLADPLVVLQVGPDTFPARARTATDSERPALWSRMTALFPKYTDYQAKTTRQIPIVILDPIPEPPT
ncbi:MAG TPA: nitroreductase family deazaflavin-dependent oxidoreductase [Actinophytocola sp.]|uniref:nitroreductase family deazaflavin-dependent oxidoreductase n=1 Tax=Actinophytocola sp. TaxID=1872138 RepID=UPI002DDD7BDB|nr:nitroreductase family deazaflavin-dependent oxidoreductase [Actinophytocola sp.]HEV2779269.1 nitroreductase family deazaflavin-dependent oxidoreductase [Actinophytocola sp.]